MHVQQQFLQNNLFKTPIEDMDDDALLEAAYYETAVMFEKFEDDWKYGREEHLAMLKKYGFNNIDDYNKAVEEAPWMKLYNILSFLIKQTGNTPQGDRIVKELRAARMWGPYPGEALRAETMAQYVCPFCMELYNLVNSLISYGYDYERALNPRNLINRDE